MTQIASSWSLGHVWPSKAAMARHIGEPLGTVGPWFAKGRRIPPARFVQIINAAAELGHELTWQQLQAINDQQDSDADQPEADAA
ncbi:hypothetical protein [Roseicyclus marinus]|uniref:hypothetical protein n=1 Tax=Roseicyclus marinus TaxID=2161673 RepID=UPI002410305E|nr:hypothetical protein [Roseicyclus marinus]MDG3040459.1 hypothetical protein [Roseicyclus marinus]